ncbi:hypothetical protein [Massilia sp. TS11]|uniref:hypothetical protein n=1 Tax=Massilia sp. TS11 TaxID=2908003 RepID=UPI001EDC33EA|nr:hypothetical protein [Massilia sp. TS11]MCG2586813.1 hypothetical protein [Massilia sp. TS11]
MLLVSVYPGVNGLLLPERLALAGCEVLYAGSLEHLAAQSRHLRARFEIPRDGERVHIEALRAAFELHAPSRFVPLDEPAVVLIEQFARTRSEGAPAWMARMAEVARASLGSGTQARQPVRQRTAAMARAAGLAMAPQCDNPDLDAALAFGAAHGYPLYLKLEHSAGGAGVTRLADAQAVRDWHARKPLPAPQQSVLQAEVSGRLGMFAAVAEQGRMLAGVAAFQVQTRSDSALAPSSVVRVGPDAAMARAAQDFIGAHGLTGMHGWDFIIGPDGEPRLIEWNPRAISISHLGHLVGADLCGVWAEALRGAAPHAARLADSAHTVALFPYEWVRDPRSPWLRTALTDLPWDDAPLVSTVMQKTLRFA